MTITADEMAAVILIAAPLMWIAVSACLTAYHRSRTKKWSPK